MSRQIERTRLAITSAFTELVLSVNYEKMSMADIARHANVGRSTIYQHYTDKDAVLLDSMSWILDGLVGCVNSNYPDDKTVHLLEHIWEHRDKARRLLFGTTGQKLEQVLRTKIAMKINEAAQDDDWLVSPIFVANQIAAALLSVLRSWVAAEASASPRQLAQQLCRSANALNQAALG